tara:strand:+ start:451 stop:612 length:162 start_codon:yes stop_codon:yes gene_type:complete
MEKDPGDKAQSGAGHAGQIAKRGGPRPERRHQENAGARGGGAVILKCSCQRTK